jgi:hypothetical protein
MWAALAPLFDELGGEGIDFLALKGLHLAPVLYDDMKLRSLGQDVDLLFHREDLKPLDTLLQGLGFEPAYILKRTDIGRQLEVEGLTLRYRTRGGFYLEAHTELTPSLAEHRLDVNRTWNRAQTVSVRDRDLRTLHSLDLIVHLAIHLHKHFALQGAPLIWWCDLVEAWKAFGLEMDPNRFREELDQQGVLDVVSGILTVTRTWFSSLVPEVLRSRNEVTIREFEGRLLEDLRKGPRPEVSPPESFFTRLGRVRSLRAALRALWLDLFPSPEFMMRRYGCRSKTLIWLLYPLRWADAIHLEIKRALLRRCSYR